MRAQDVKALADLLQKNTSITEINLNENHLGDQAPDPIERVSVLTDDPCLIDGTTA